MKRPWLQVGGLVFVLSLRIAGAQSCIWNVPLIPAAGAPATYWGDKVSACGTDSFIANSVSGNDKVVVYRRSATGVSQSQEINPGMQVDGLASANYTLAISTESGNGLVRIYRRAPSGTYSFVQSLSGSAFGQDFGFSCALNEDATTLVIGAPNASTGSIVSHGRVFVYGLNASGTYSLLSSLTQSPPVSNAQFGQRVALSGARILCSKGDTFPGGFSLYSFVRTGSIISPESQPPFGLSDGDPPRTLRMSGDWAAASASFSNAIDLFERTASGWILRDSITTSSQVYDLDLSDNVLCAVVDGFAESKKEVRIYRRQGSPSSWFQENAIETPFSFTDAACGIAMFGDQATVGGPYYEHASAWGHGAAVLIDSGFSDCNQNGFADECDIASGLATDLDVNSIPDSCESIPVPSGLAASDGSSDTSVAITWIGVPGVVAYQLERSPNGTSWTTLSSAASSPYADTSAAVATTYQYRVRAMYAGGVSAPTDVDSGWRNLPAPTGTSATDGTRTSDVQISWSPVAGAVGYRVWRAEGVGAPIELGPAATTSFSDEVAVPGVAYQYSVAARSALGDTARGAADVGWRNLPPPAGIQASDGTSISEVTVAWTDVTGATLYRVERAIGSAAFVEIGTALPGSGVYADAGANAPTAGTLYSYRVRAVSPGGDSQPSVLDTGWRSLPAPSGLTASDGLTSGIQLSWSSVLGALDYTVYRSLGSAPSEMIGPSSTSTFVDSMAVAGLTYTYHVRARTAVGESIASATETGWRGIAAPLGLAASDGTATNGIQLTWSPVAGSTGYKVFRRLGGAAPTEVGSPQVEAFLDATASPGLSYVYTVRAATPSGDSAESAADTGWRSLPAPVNVNASDGLTTEGVSVTWAAVDGAIGYRVFRTIGSAAPTQIGIPSDASFLDNTAVAGTLYTYTIRARTFLGDSAASGPETGWRNLPAPANLAATDGTLSTGVNITWNTVTGATGYRLYRATGSAAAAEVATPAASSHVDTTATPGVPYTYFVRARTAAGDSASSNPDNGWRPLAAPTALIATDGTRTDGVLMSWNATAGATGYRVFRTIGAGTPTEVGTPSQSPFLDGSALPGTAYTYSIRARSDAGDSVPSNSDVGWRNVEAPTGLAATDGTLTSGVQLTWNAVGNALGYRVYRGIGSATPTEIGAPGTTSYVDSTAVAGTLYSYTVRAQTTPGNSAASTADSGWRNVAAPTAVSATDGTLSTGVSVSWTASAGAAGYRVYRSMEGGTPLEVAAPTASPYLDATAVPGIQYAYSVRARTAAGDSAIGGSDLGWRNIVAPTGLAATDGIHTDAVVISWNAVPGATSYRVFRSIGTTTATEIGTPAGNSFADVSALPGTVYTYSVRARTALSESGTSTTETGWRNLPAPPGLAATDGTLTTGVNLTWNSVSGAIGYRVFRAIGTAVPAQIATTIIPSFADNTAVAGTLYAYTIKAQSAAGDSAASGPDSGWRNVASPTSLAATDGSLTTGVNLTWTTVTGAAGYRILRSSEGQGEVEIATPNAPPYLDQLAFAGVTYTYKVLSHTAAGNSLPNGTLDSGWRNLPAPSNLNATDGTQSDGVGLTWTPVTGALGYRVFRAIGTATATEIASPSLAAFSDTDAVVGTVYTYTVKARCLAGDSAASAANTGWKNLPAPSGLLAGDGASTSAVALSWNLVPGATGFQVFRSTGSAAPIQLASIAPTINVYSDSSAVAGTLYTYTVRASTAAGPSASSTPNDGWRNVPAPTGLAATDGTFADRVRLTWTASSDAAVLGYRIMRQLPGEKSLQLWIVTPRTAVTFDDFSIPEGVLGTYTLQAVTNAGYSSPSAANTGFRGSTVVGDPPSHESTPEGGTDWTAGTMSAQDTDGSASGPAGPGAGTASGTDFPDPDSEPTGGDEFPTCEDLLIRLEYRLAMVESDPAEDDHRTDHLRFLMGEGAATPGEASGDAPPHASCIPACSMATGDMDLDGYVTWGDLVTFLAWWSDQDPLADLDRDGRLDGRDVQFALHALGVRPYDSTGDEIQVRVKATHSPISAE